MIEAFHSNWTRPFFEMNKDEEYYIEDFEILTTMLSALMWRRNNGKIKMITDSIGAKYYRKIGIESIWDLGIDTSLDNINYKEINPNIFWAAGKIYALKNQSIPCLMMDTDFIIWDNIEKELIDCNLATIHKEAISELVYPSVKSFNMKDGYMLNKDLDWSVLPSNTAMAYINDENFKNYYTKTSIDFMKNLILSDDKLINMVFAEQRLFSMCAKIKNINIKELHSLEELRKSKQKHYTHVWGYKDVMRKNFKKREEFCIKCIKRIVKEFPKYKDIIESMYELRYYYNQLKK